MNTEKSNHENKKNPLPGRLMLLDGIDYKSKQMLCLIEAVISLGLHNNAEGITEEDTRPDADRGACFIGNSPSETFYYLGRLAETLRDEIVEHTEALMKM